MPTSPWCRAPNALNVVSWGPYIPGWHGPNATGQVETFAAGVPTFYMLIIVWYWPVYALVRRVTSAHPEWSLARMVGLVVVIGVVVELLAEIVWLASGTYTYTLGPSLFSGEARQQPLLQAGTFAYLSLLPVMMKLLADRRGREVAIFRGGTLLPPRMWNSARLRAGSGFTNVICIGFLANTGLFAALGPRHLHASAGRPERPMTSNAVTVGIYRVDEWEALPCRRTSQERSVAWARRHSLVVDAVDEERFRNWDIAGLMARWVPDAVGADLDLAVDATLVATILDDEFDSPLGRRPQEVAQICDELAALIAAEGPAEARTPLGRGLADVWERFSQGASHDWLARHRRHWGWNFEAHVAETGNRARHVVPPPEEYFQLRRKAGIVYAMLDMSEKACRFETSEQLRQQPHVRRMLQITVDFIDTVNDVHSLEKEESRGDCHNLVLVLEHAQGWSRSRCLTEITKITSSWCAEFEERATQLVGIEDGAADGTGRLVDCLRDAMSGYLAWSRATRRYSRLVPPDEPAFHSTLI
jgi:hypothetical protein